MKRCVYKLKVVLALQTFDYKEINTHDNKAQPTHQVPIYCKQITDLTVELVRINRN